MSTTPAARWRRTLAQALKWNRIDEPQPAAPVEDLRELCRSLVADLGPAQQHEVHLCLTQARSADDIWHLRSHLFGLISLEHGEHVARERLKRLDSHWQ